jgi:hypothetical protein
MSSLHRGCDPREGPIKLTAPDTGRVCVCVCGWQQFAAAVSVVK